MDENGSRTEKKCTCSIGLQNLCAFWILGLTNNFAYVVMLSGAHDILHSDEEKNSTSANETVNRTGHLIPQCNPIGTGAILLADILPALIVKLAAPYFAHYIPYSVRVFIVILSSAASFLVVALIRNVSLLLLGVACASLGSGLGEFTFLSLTAFYDSNCVSSWSSGTGAAGVFGALSYAGLTAAGLSPRNAILTMLVVPGLMAIAYFLLMTKHTKQPNNMLTSSSQLNACNNPSVSTESSEHNLLIPSNEADSNSRLPVRARLKIFQKLLKYIVPLTTVYFAEYFINQALFELIQFSNNPKWMDTYRWYQVTYQVGVFVSRSSVNICPIPLLWPLPLLQFCNLTILLCDIFFAFIPSVWLVLCIILFEGLLGGAAYVNTYFKISKEMPEDEVEFSMGATSVSDSVGIALAGAVAIPVHNYICSL